MFQVMRLVGVIGLLVASAMLATPKNRLPLALRGLSKIIAKDRGKAITNGEEMVPARRRIMALMFIIIAILIAII